MNAKPIIFSAPMISALLSGAKCQTRRIVKPQPADGKHWHGWVLDSTDARDIGKACWGYGTDSLTHGLERIRCPYGKPCDLIYVKEAWRVAECYDTLSGAQLDGKLTTRNVQYEAAGDPFLGIVQGRYRHARFMPRWASRLTLQITDVRVQRLQDISEAYACAEGLRVFNEDDAILYYDGWHLNPVDAFRELWQSINGPDSWDVNPWVWSLSFRVIHANVDAVLADPAAHGAEVRNAA